MVGVFVDVMFMGVFVVVCLGDCIAVTLWDKVLVLVCVIDCDEILVENCVAV